MQHLRYALDKIFLFMICLSLTIFMLNLASLADSAALFAMHVLNVVILLGYALFFAYDLSLSKNKLAYCKKHWMLALLIVLPAISIFHLVRFLPAREALSISQNVAWYLFDEAGML